MTVSRRLRYEILRRDNHACRYCGAIAPDAALTVDHVVPVALGGSDDPTNLVTACIDCNAGKASTHLTGPLVADVAADAARWAAAMAMVAAAEYDNPQTEIVERVGATWDGFRDAQGQLPRPASWHRSIHGMLAAGAVEADFMTAIDIAMDHTRINRDDVWRYACGVVWRKIEQRQESARALLQTEQPGDSAPEDRGAI